MISYYLFCTHNFNFNYHYIFILLIILSPTNFLTMIIPAISFTFIDSKHTFRKKNFYFYFIIFLRGNNFNKMLFFREAMIVWWIKKKKWWSFVWNLLRMENLMPFYAAIKIIKVWVIFCDRIKLLIIVFDGRLDHVMDIIGYKNRRSIF